MPESKFNPLGIIDNIIGTSFDEDQSSNKPAMSDEDIRKSSPEYKQDIVKFNSFLDDEVFSDENLMRSYADTDSFADIFKDEDKLEEVSDKIRRSIGINPWYMKDVENDFKSLKKSDVTEMISSRIAEKSEDEYKLIRNENLFEAIKDNESYYDVVDQTIEDDITASPEAKLASKYRNSPKTEADRKEYEQSINTLNKKKSEENKIKKDLNKVTSMASGGVGAVGLPDLEQEIIVLDDFKEVTISNFGEEQKVTSEVEKLIELRVKQDEPTLESLYNSNVEDRVAFELKGRQTSDYISEGGTQLNMFMQGMGYTGTKQEDGNFIYKDVKYKDVLKYSTYLNESDDSLKPVTFDGSAEDFEKALVKFKDINKQIQIERKALNHAFIENKSLRNIEKSDLTEMVDSASKLSFFGLDLIPYGGLESTPRKEINAVENLLLSAGKELSPEDKEYSRVDFSEQLATETPGMIQAVGELAFLGSGKKLGMTLIPALVRLNKAAAAIRYTNKAGKIVNVASKLKKGVRPTADAIKEFASVAGYKAKRANPIAAFGNTVLNLAITDLEFQLIGGKALEGSIFGGTQQILGKLTPKTASNIANFFTKISSGSIGFVTASEASKIGRAAVDELLYDESFTDFMDEEFNDYFDGKKDIRDLLQRGFISMTFGAMLPLKDAKSLDFKTNEGLIEIRNSSIVLIAKAQKNGDVKAEKRHVDIYTQAQSRIDIIAKAERFSNPLTSKRAYEELLKPQANFFKMQGYNLNVEVINKKTESKNQAEFKSDGTGKGGTITINTVYAERAGVVPHEVIHAAADMVFGKNIKAKKQFQSQLEGALSQIKLPSGKTVLQEIKDRKSIKKEVKLEEMMAYAGEFLAEPGMRDFIVNSEGYTNVKKVIQKNMEQSIGKEFVPELSRQKDVIDFLYNFTNNTLKGYNPLLNIKSSFAEHVEAVEFGPKQERLQSEKLDKEQATPENIEASKKTQDKYENFVKEGLSTEQIYRKLTGPSVSEVKLPSGKTVLQENQFGEFTAIAQSVITSYINRYNLKNIGSIKDNNSTAYYVATEMIYGPRGISSIIKNYNPEIQPLTKNVLNILRTRAPGYFKSALEFAGNIGNDISDPSVEAKLNEASGNFYDFQEPSSYSENNNKTKSLITVEKQLGISPESNVEMVKRIQEVIESTSIEALTHAIIQKATADIGKKAIFEALDLTGKSGTKELKRQKEIIEKNASKIYELTPKSLNPENLTVTNAAKSFPSLFAEVGRAKFSTAPSSMTKSQKGAGVKIREKVLDSTGKILVDAIFKEGDTNQQSAKRIISLGEMIGGTYSNQKFREVLSNSTYQEFLYSTNRSKLENLKLENILEGFKGSLPESLASENLGKIEDYNIFEKEFKLINWDDLRENPIDKIINIVDQLKSLTIKEKDTLLKEINDNFNFQLKEGKAVDLKTAMEEIKTDKKTQEEVLNAFAENSKFNEQMFESVPIEQYGNYGSFGDALRKQGVPVKFDTNWKKDINQVEDFNNFTTEVLSPLPKYIRNLPQVKASFGWATADKPELRFNVNGKIVHRTAKMRDEFFKDKFSNVDSKKETNSKVMPARVVKSMLSKAVEANIDPIYIAKEVIYGTGKGRSKGLIKGLTKKDFNTEKEYKEYKKKITSKEKDGFKEYLQLVRANRDVHLQLLTSIFEVYSKDPSKNLENVFRLFQMETSNRNFLSNASNYRFVSIIPATNKSAMRSEHSVHLSNFYINTMMNMISNNKNIEKFKSNQDKLQKSFNQSIINEEVQKYFDSKEQGGFSLGIVTSTAQNPVMNWARNKFLLENTVDLRTGKTLKQGLEESVGVARSYENIKDMLIRARAADIKVGNKTNAEIFVDLKLKGISETNKKLQEITLASENLSKELNTAIENKFGVPKEKVFSKIEASKLGADANKLKLMAWSAQDFRGLLQPLKGKGVIGDAAENWIQKNLVRPFAIANRNIDADRVAMTNDFAALKKELKGLIPDLTSKAKIEGLSKNIFSNQDAVRVYIWNKQGNTTTGLNEGQVRRLSEYVSSNPQLQYFADKLIEMGKGEGYVEPGENWETGTITTDLLKGLNENGRAKHLEEWQANVDIIFSEDNLNKIQAILGSNHREALENSLQRMKTGRNKINMFSGKGARLENLAIDWLNNSVGAIMFLNSRSAVLQTLSSINYINWSDNNVLAAGKAVANQKQYWKDFTTIFNSDFLVERRGGLKINVSESEIADAAANSKNKVKGALNYILQKGFGPTKYADSFAIATGGATFYRNRLNRYLKQGLNERSAKDRAFEDFREVTEQSQQSSRPDLISQQQASTLGRLVLAFGNTPAQYVRIMDKSLSDLRNGRGNWKEHVSKIIYYSTIQNLMFSAAQNALFVGLFEETDDTTDDKKVLGMANQLADGLLKGMGIAGAAVSTSKNIMLEIHKQNNKKKSSFKDVSLKLLDMSPPVDSKIGKLRSAGLTFDYNMDEIKSKGFSLDNPAYLAGAQVVSGGFNIPLDRVFRKYNNISNAFDTDTKNWKRPFLMMGWSEWELNATEEERKSGKFKPLTKKQKSLRIRLKRDFNLNDKEVEEYINNKKNK